MVRSVIVLESVVPLYERVARKVCGPLGSSAPAVKSIPVPRSGWKTSVASGLSVGKTPLWKSPVELTSGLGARSSGAGG